MTIVPGPIPPLPGPDLTGQLPLPTDDDALDVVDLLERDHRDVEAIFGELEKPGTNPQRRRDLVHVVIAELMRHSAAEEQHLYPAVREYLPGGDRMADHEIAEHARAEAVMSQLMKLEATDDTFEHLLAKLISDVRHHVREEEQELFPRLRAGCDRTTLVALGEKVLAAEKIGPTRPHPGAPDTPPLNRLAAPVMGAVDRARDAVTHRPTSRDEVPGEG
jgi:hemerythrin superfamily protein